jgi:hypothetical protein
MTHCSRIIVIKKKSIVRRLGLVGGSTAGGGGREVSEKEERIKFQAGIKSFIQAFQELCELGLKRGDNSSSSPPCVMSEERIGGVRMVDDNGVDDDVDWGQVIAVFAVNLQWLGEKHDEFTTDII